MSHSRKERVGFSLWHGEDTGRRSAGVVALYLPRPPPPRLVEVVVVQRIVSVRTLRSSRHLFEVREFVQDVVVIPPRLSAVLSRLVDGV